MLTNSKRKHSSIHLHILCVHKNVSWKLDSWHVLKRQKYLMKNNIFCIFFIYPGLTWCQFLLKRLCDLWARRMWDMVGYFVFRIFVISKYGNSKKSMHMGFFWLFNNIMVFIESKYVHRTRAHLLLIFLLCTRTLQVILHMEPSKHTVFTVYPRSWGMSSFSPAWKPPPPPRGPSELPNPPRMSGCPPLGYPLCRRAGIRSARARAAGEAARAPPPPLHSPVRVSDRIVPLISIR
jgi:hypothetical protein